MSRRHTALGLALLLALTGCSSTPGEPGPGAAAGSAPAAASDSRPRSDLVPGGRLTLPITGIPTQLNRFHLEGALASWQRITSATDPGLYRYSATGEITPRRDYLLTMPQVSRRGERQVITYRLNPKARWNDGTPIDHTAFAATWQTLRDPRTGAVPQPAYAAVESVRPGASPHEVVVTLSHPQYPVTDLFTWLVHPRLARPGAFADLMQDAAHPELRSGPYTIAGVDRRAGTVTLDRNPRWWGDRPLLDRIVFRALDPRTAVTAFRAGELDVVDLPSLPAEAQLRGAPDTDIRRGQDTSTTVLVLNSASPNLPPPVRAAVWAGIDRAGLARVRFQGGTPPTPAGSAVLLPYQPGARDNVTGSGDPAAARRTLDAAGWRPGTDGIRTRDGKRLTVRFTLHGEDPIGTALARTVQTQLQAVGIEVRIDTRPPTAFGDTMKHKDYDLLLGGGATDSPDPTGLLCQTMCSTSPGNASGVGTREIDARIARLATVADPAARTAEINDIEHDWLGLHGQLPLWHGQDVQARRRGLSGLGPEGFAGTTPRWEDVGWAPGSPGARR